SNNLYNTSPLSFCWGASCTSSLSSWNSSSGDTNSQTANPLLVNSNAIPPRLWSDPSLSPPSAPQPLAQMIANYLLTRSSPAINAGVTLSGFNTDITGDIRTAGAWDIGADEFGGSATTVNVGGSATTVDFDGDGRSDIALYRDGVWWILRSSNGG